MGTGKDRGARRRAWEVLWRTQRQGAYPDLLLTSLLAADPSMEKSDRALAHELVMGTLRWQLTLDRVLSKVSQRPLSRIPAKLLVALRLGAYQLLFLERIPPSAAVNETVELVRSIGLEHATGFANAVLRAIAQRGRSLMEVESTASLAERISVETSHPLWMVEMWLEQWGERETRELCQANNEVAPLTLRTNTLKITREGLLEALREEGVEATPTPFSPEGVEITGLKVPLSTLKSFRMGLFQVQDEASQLISHWMEIAPGQRVLDACAAPGGKTTHMAQLLQNRGELVAVDVHQERLNLVSRECKRLGISCVKIEKGDLLDPQSLGEEKFDRILLDAPCSGLGVLRRNPDMKWRRSPKDIQRMASIQKRMLENLAPHLRPQGILLYSVCTHTREETEGVLEAILEEGQLALLKTPGGLPLPARGLVGEDGLLRTFPHKHGMDGFTAFRLTPAP
jgi:16S rRNA (cytosine967-C5)-methyltransferase